MVHSVLVGFFLLLLFSKNNYILDRNFEYG